MASKLFANGYTSSGVKVHPEIPWRQKSAEEREAALADIRAKNAQPHHWDTIKDLLGASWKMFGLFNHDPYIARISLIQEAGQQINTQRQIQAQNRAQDQDAELERAKLQGRAMADAMIERLEERGFKQ